jgi:UDP-N-acetylmuramoyl-L-alanyl-D-glutamate--2,6-diaminopimelate ligase
MDIKKVLGSYAVNGLPDGLEITGLAVDSREVKEGDLFFAISGAHTDGHLYIADAISRGARAIVTETCAPDMGTSRLPFIKVDDIQAALASCATAFYSNPSAGLEVVGVTGTNGKTTTTYLLESIWKTAGRKNGVIGTINYRVDGEVLRNAVNTTPHALTLQKLFANMRDHGCSSALMEISSHSLSLKRVDGILFDCAVFMNLTRDHLDFHLTQDEYFLAKLKLFEMLGSPKNPKKNRLAVINGDDPRASKVRAALPAGVKVFTFGLGAANDFRAENINSRLDGTSFDMVCPAGRFGVELKLWGAYNVFNALAAAACAFGRGIKTDDIIAGLAALESVPGRMEAIRAGQDFHVFVDFAHTDSALDTVLSALSGFPHGKIYTVFGCGGERDRTKRGPMGVVVTARSSHAFITADNPRRESLEQIFADIEAGLKAAGRINYSIIADRTEAVRQAVEAARKGDIVLLAGKGHETVQRLSAGVIPYNDSQTAAAMIKEKLASK